MDSGPAWPPRAVRQFWPAGEPRVGTSSLSVMRKSLTKREIIKRKGDIAKIFSTGRRYAGRNLKLIVCQNDLEISRIIVIPVRNYGNSVKRNRIRRQIKEIWRTEKHAMIPGHDVAFVVYPGKSYDHASQRTQIISLCQKAGLRSSGPEGLLTST